MGLERRIAWAALGGTALAALMWGAAQANFHWPPLVVYGAIILGALGTAISAALWVHIGWVWLRTKGLQLVPAIIIAISLAGLAIGGVWAAITWKPMPKDTVALASIAAPNISLQRYALFWVQLEPDVYQLEAIVKLFNSDNRPHLISSVNFDNISITTKARGQMLMQRGFVPLGQAVQLNSDNYIEAGRAAYFPVSLPLKLYAKQIAGSFPAVYTFGTWRLQIGGQHIEVMPRRTTTYPSAISTLEWNDLLKTSSKINIDALDYEPMPGPEGNGPLKYYLVFNPDRTATINDFWFAETPPVKGENGVMMFIGGKGEPPLAGGWIILGNTYHEVWSDPEKLALYDSLYPPDENGKPRPFIFFAGAEAAMTGEPISNAARYSAKGDTKQNNSIGTISGNAGIITQGQSGDNSK